MKKALKDEWLSALRSGKWETTLDGHLGVGTQRSPLGVLLEITETEEFRLLPFRTDGLKGFTLFYSEIPMISTIPSGIRSRFHLTFENVEGILGLGKKVSLDIAAKWIEENVEGIED